MSGIICAYRRIVNEDRVFIITGGGSGIGKALALNLAERGKSVLIVGRRESLLKETAAASALIKYVCADVSTSEGREIIRVHLNNIPQISALVNNAGTLEPLVPIQDIQLADWHRTFATNLDAPLFLPQLFIDKLQHGRVLNIGSGAAYFPIKGWTAYCVSKAALSMLTRCCQLETDSISFASVMPGIIDTEMQVIARNGSNMDPEQVHFYQRLKQHNRLISPETVAEFLTWLLLDIDKETYVSKEWDIYESSHHASWLKPPHQVLHWDF
ncbi:SDR family NAD(P)-dependent oxidoreductase [Legionella sp. km535]|uniref:SDR family NAD(P)-dependent oxidoreductase n=1 Tax=Legionella sp. km535 TaxID=2498107 RepID=UPI0018F69B2B|nr:SDR family NAD(P)-dependent oxidoreductase [Legionella sp. km535]